MLPPPIPAEWTMPAEPGTMVVQTVGCPSPSRRAQRNVRHHRPSFILAVAVLASGFLGCRSAAPDLAPQAAAPPAESVPPVATAAPVLPPSAPTEEAPLDEAVADATIGEAPLEEEGAPVG